MSRTSLAVATCLLSLGSIGIIVACGGNDPIDPCDVPVPGIYVPGIDLLVRDASGQGLALGDTAITYRGTDSAITRGFDTLHVWAGFGAPGTFAVRVKRKFYRETVVPSVVVNAGVCGTPVTTTLPVTLELAPGAPAFRSIAVFGAHFLAVPGEQSQAVARVDADPSAPRTVTWRLSDTSIARVDVNGVITAKCTTTSNATDTVTALATIDTTVRGTSLFGVARQGSCP